MDTRSLLRWSGFAFGSGGLLFAVYDVYSFVVSSQTDGFTQATVIGLWILMVAGLLVLLGFPGLYAAQSRETGFLGLSGYLLSFLGIALFFAFAWGGVTIAPEIADEATTFIAEGPESKLAQFLFVTGRRIFASIGLLLFAVATLRAAVFRRWGPILLIIAGVLGGLAVFGVANLLPVGVVAIAGLGLATLGFELFAGVGKDRFKVEVSVDNDSA